ncbi:hypothetical protein F5Y10DRAFT_287126 [Nemania abortiva]|nr:hypothetical protein F5Y10DRAFT_287126 [Nemania abortiva]
MATSYYLGRFLNPLGGLEAIYNILLNDARVIEALRAWQPVSLGPDGLDDLVYAIVSFIGYGFFLYCVFPPLIIVYALGYWLAALARFLWDLVSNTAYIIGSLIMSIAIPMFGLESIRALLMFFAVPEEALSIKYLDAYLGFVAFCLCIAYGVVARRPLNDVLRDPDAVNRSVGFWLCAAILYLVVAYIVTLSLAPVDRFAAMGFVFCVALSSLARVTESVMYWRYVWLVLAIAQTYFVYVFMSDFSGGLRWFGVFSSSVMSFLVLEIVGASHLGDPMRQRQTTQYTGEAVAYWQFPPDSAMHFWIIATTNVVSHVNMKIASWQEPAQVVTYIIVSLVAYAALVILGNASQASVMRDYIARVESDASRGLRYDFRRVVPVRADTPYYEDDDDDDDDRGAFFGDDDRALTFFNYDGEGNEVPFDTPTPVPVPAPLPLPPAPSPPRPSVFAFLVPPSQRAPPATPSRVNRPELFPQPGRREHRPPPPMRRAPVFNANARPRPSPDVVNRREEPLADDPSPSAAAHWIRVRLMEIVGKHLQTYEQVTAITARLMATHRGAMILRILNHDTVAREMIQDAAIQERRFNPEFDHPVHPQRYNPMFT